MASTLTTFDQVLKDIYRCDSCPLCGTFLLRGSRVDGLTALAEHCRGEGDPDHLALEVMET